MDFLHIARWDLNQSFKLSEVLLASFIFALLCQMYVFSGDSEQMQAALRSCLYDLGYRNVQEFNLKI